MEIEKLRNESMETIVDFIENILVEIEEAIVQLQSGNDKAANGLILEIAEGLQLILEAMELTKESHHIEYSNIVPVLDNMVQAMQNGDYVTVCDILEYEIVVIIKGWESKILDCLKK